MSSLAVLILQATAFIIATVALFLNINAAVGLSTDQRIQLSVDVNILDSLPSSYPLWADNITVNTAGIRTLDQCVIYVETHVPIVQSFNTTIIINTTYAEAQLANLTSLMQSRGIVHIEQLGTVQIVETNATIVYSKEYITFANTALHYIGIPATTTMTVPAGMNGTTALTFTNWSPSLGVSDFWYGCTGYDAIYDINQLDIQSALPVMRVQKKQYLDNGAISVGESTVALNQGDVLAIVRNLQL